MKRQIKFRAWGEKSKIMWNHRELLTWSPVDFLQLFDPDSLHVFKVMQYTGLKDKKGKEIYEGDILEWTARDNDNSIMSVIDIVKWKNGSFVTGEGVNEESVYDDVNRRQVEKQSKIIGNIYETPELIK